MSDATVLITGGYGCIGAETTKWFLRETSASVVIGSRSVSEERTQRVFADVDRDRLKAVSADVTSVNAMAKVLDQFAVSHVVHLAALQTPECNANRDLGLQVNLAGTQNLIEAMKNASRQIEKFVFASSVAVYGPRHHYPVPRVPCDAEPQPVNVYGIWKLAGEHLSRSFFEETGIPTICLRPGVLYGPGRDIGLTSTPTTAMKHVVLGSPYHIPFASRQDYLFAPDVGASTAISTIQNYDGYGVFTLPGVTCGTQEFVEVMQVVAEQMGCFAPTRITFGQETVPFICDLDFSSFLAAFPNVPRTPLDKAIRRSLEVFRDQHQRGWL
ncbi:NAD(P)-dependent oxidoreductase [bacterium]|nr:NAD(P)-dependent oxidoreductase [bacterium]